MHKALGRSYGCPGVDRGLPGAGRGAGISVCGPATRRGWRVTGWECGLAQGAQKVPDSWSALSGPDTGEGLAGMLMGLWGRGRIREAGVMLGVGSKGPF